jgi:hypothetical protein
MGRGAGNCGRLPAGDQKKTVTIVIRMSISRELGDGIMARSRETGYLFYVISPIVLSGPR